MTYEKQFVGYLFAVSLTQERTWSDDDINLIRMMGHIFVNAISRKKND